MIKLIITEVKQSRLTYNILRFIIIEIYIIPHFLGLILSDNGYEIAKFRIILKR